MIEAAPAKVNLCLHVTGQRADGYHLLDSLVVFAGVGDQIAARPGDGLSLRVTGPAAAGLSAGPDNLVLRAARAFGTERGAAIELQKILPVASGIGGGSADAAATLRLLARLWQLPLPDAATVLALGADVPVCLAGRPVRMQGIGEGLTELPALPPAWLVLVNPGVAVATPAVFRGLARKTNPSMPEVPRFTDVQAMATWLADQRNDLEPAAEGLAPVIGVARRALAVQPGCLLARMSGSGATCFGLFEGKAQAEAAAREIRAEQSDWWVAAAPILQAG